MIPSHPSSLLALVLLQGVPGGESFSATTCEDNPRIELSREPAAVVREICVSPGSMTGFLFDAPFSVEIQDEVRFGGVLRGRSGISLVPPQDLAPGARLRLTARVGEGESQRSITFMLVARPGQATRQVDVYQDRRTRESYEQEVEQERAKSRMLREENRQLRTRLLGAVGLRGLFLEFALDGVGVKRNKIVSGEPAAGQQSGDAPLLVSLCESYRSLRSVAVGLQLQNLGSEPWILEAASLVTSTGAELEGLMLGPAEAIAPQEVGRVVMELDATMGAYRGEYRLILRDTRGRILSLSQISFP